jgi:uncharacterized protein
VKVRIKVSQPQTFALRLRIPEWAPEARIEIDGARAAAPPVAGTFAAITRTWRDGDTVELYLPRRPRLERLDREHPDIVALMCGPLVLFPVGAAAGDLRPQRSELLAARTVGARRWQAEVGGSSVTFLPYVEIDEQPYATLMRLAPG